MNPGTLNKKIIIKQQPVSQDDSDKPINTWPTVSELWASINPLSGREYFAAQQANSEVSHKVNIRYNGSIKANMRILYGERAYEILYLIDPGERHIELNLMCKELL
ncbi:phage head closure protein [Dehalobacter sp. DCM]|uniref:phage head closure protein n=1 Tax=Dehalobacter sp. DCM TaxID=2907827 RepID=UPI00308154F4|nr:phage head closure protein [Dehalobacter sp. DCM]